MPINVRICPTCCRVEDSTGYMNCDCETRTSTVPATLYTQDELQKEIKSATIFGLRWAYLKAFSRYVELSQKGEEERRKEANYIREQIGLKLETEGSNP